MNIVPSSKIAQSSSSVLAPELMARFAAIVGEKYAVTDPQETAPYLTEERGLFSGHSPLILRPGSTAEVSAICKLATETRTALVPQGGNTGLVGGQIPHNNEVVISLRRLDKVRAVDTQSNTMTVEAGVILANAQQQAADADRLFPLSLGAEGSCTIGGNLSTNAGGIAALAYGVARDLVLGLEVVLADGRIMHGLSSLKKDNTGYDPARSVRRRGRHAGHHHCRDAEDVSISRARSKRRSRPSSPRRMRSCCWTSRATLPPEA